MRVMISLEDRFFRTAEGAVYSNTVFDYTFWQRYLQAFDEVVVLARVKSVSQPPRDVSRADGPGVRFAGLPYYVGPREYVKVYGSLRRTVRQATEKADAFILRVPGRISSLLAGALRQHGRPYGVEVVGNSADTVKTAGVNPVLAAVLSLTLPRRQRRLCREAAAAAYVSQGYLQAIYPPGGWSTYYSSIELPDEALANEAQFEQRVARLAEAADGQRPWRLCHAGSMGALYKGQDVLIDAVGRCREQGLALHLSLMGGGKYLGQFEEHARAVGVDDITDFIGWVEAGEPVREQLDRADLFVFPSLTEGLPRAVIEAMARGLPCVASSVGGIPELLAAEDMVDAGDAGVLAEKLLTVLQNPQRMERMARRNLVKAREYRSDLLNARRIEFYKKVAQLTQQTHEGVTGPLPDARC